ncbi:MAG: hypothetical protein GDA50_06835 [Alphaproteobacteria bacterium GM202ARS2]|nr:hypothetical protein [Alphaproteobacteria bacterium GM202ARS2]
MSERTNRIRAFVRGEWGCVSHGGRTAADHCLGVGALLEEAGAQEQLVHAGLMHVIYGAESYPGLEDKVGDCDASLLTAEERALIHHYSRVSEKSLSIAGITSNPGFLRDRDQDDPLEFSREESKHVCLLLLVNILEQFLAEPDNPIFQAQRNDLARPLAGLAQISGEIGMRIYAMAYHDHKINNGSTA